MNIQIIVAVLKSDSPIAIVSNSNTWNKHLETIGVFGRKGKVLKAPSQNNWSRIFGCVAQEISFYPSSMWL